MIALSPASRAPLLLGVSFTVIAALVAFVYFAFDGGDTPSNLTVDEIYRRADASLLAPGQVYHATIHVNRIGRDAFTARRELWVDPAAPVAQELTVTAVPGSTQSSSFAALFLPTETRAVSKDDAAAEEGKSERRGPLSCFGAGLAASVVLGCPSPDGTITSVWNGTIEGRKAVIVRTEGTYSIDNVSTRYTDSLYLDRDTYLPFAFEGAGESPGQVHPWDEKRSYEATWLDRDRLPRETFTNSGIGYVPPVATPAATPTPR